MHCKCAHYTFLRQNPKLCALTTKLWVFPARVYVLMEVQGRKFDCLFFRMHSYGLCCGFPKIISHSSKLRQFREPTIKSTLFLCGAAACTDIAVYHQCTGSLLESSMVGLLYWCISTDSKCLVYLCQACILLKHPFTLSLFERST